MNKMFTLSATFLFSSFVFAGGGVTLGESTFDLERPHAVNASISAADDINGFLESYRPQGNGIRDVHVNGNVIDFIVSKRIFGIEFSSYVNAEVSVVHGNEFCPQNVATGFKLNFDLKNSEQEVFEKIQSIDMNFCVAEPATDNIHVTAKGLLNKGYKCGAPLCDIVIKEITKLFPTYVESFKGHILKQQ